MSEFVTNEEKLVMISNGRRAMEDAGYDPVPVVLLHTVDGGQAWLLAEIDPDDGDLAYGLCDLGVGLPEPGHVRLSWLAEFAGPLRMSVERDRRFSHAEARTLSHYARIAAVAGKILI